MDSIENPFNIHSTAPIRICDLGGWTDTWFAEYGSVFNIGVEPYVAVQIQGQSTGVHQTLIEIAAEDFGARYILDPEKYNSKLGWLKHPLLEAAIEFMQLPVGLDIKISIHSQVPPGAATGTSAAVTVALLGALDLLTPGQMTPHQIAQAAWKVETELLGQQCGVQDQLCCAYGGINFIEITRYPDAAVTQLTLPEHVNAELERRLVLIYLGKSHASSQTHEIVIKAMEGFGPENRFLHSLRQTAPAARQALAAGDFFALGKAMRENNHAQRELHPGLISPEADRVIEIARAHGAVGWKVNGAGGDGGSLTILAGEGSEMARSMRREIEEENPAFKHIPVRLSRQGLRVWRNSSLR